jgi:hypothetical protein
MKLLHNINKLAESVSFTYDIQWDVVQHATIAKLMQQSYEDAVEMIPLLEKQVVDSFSDDIEYDWNIDTPTEEKLSILSDPKVQFLYELYCIIHTYKRIMLINDITAS